MRNSATVVRRESHWRLVRECAFALCTVWLVVQNVLLFAVAIRHQPNTISLATYLARGASAAAGTDKWEMGHGRTR